MDWQEHILEEIKDTRKEVRECRDMILESKLNTEKRHSKLEKRMLIFAAGLGTISSEISGKLKALFGLFN